MHPILRSFLRFLAAFAAAWIVLVIIGITLCTQYVLAELAALGAPVPFGLRLQITGADIINMLPLYGVIFGAGLLIAMIAAWGFVRWGAPMPHIVYAVAGFVAIAVTLLAMKALFFGITAIAATRSVDGFVVQCLVGALAGYVFVRVREMFQNMQAV